ncbi:hypothetical protein [Ponticaulis sp.]|uniref:hypothetical protein n=1 Tax=Ponticaulis sp. TaxID=2020902 RepID=UPI0025F5896D|nr:hypothetical protein [Ponticaulis sp.]|tara:strand:- start:50063 stop:50233 length:171 start_codon:yes stop_codon:yes gene_type:complete
MSDMTFSGARKHDETHAPSEEAPTTFKEWVISILMVAGGFAVWGLLGYLMQSNLHG